MKTILPIFLVFSAALAPAAEYTLPSTNQGNWTPGVDVGVVGGIDQYLPGGANQRTNLIDVTQSPYNADNTGATDGSSAINQALRDAVANDVVYLPSGTYRIDSSIVVRKDITENMSDITIRGDGPDQTIIDCRAITGFAFSFGANFDKEDAASGIRTKGMTQFIVSDTSKYLVGRLIKITPDDEIDDTRIQAGAYPRLTWQQAFPARSTVHKITSIDSSTQFSFDPPIPSDYTPVDVTIIRQASGSTVYTLERFGIEDLRIDGSAGTAQVLIDMKRASNCWLYNVEAEEVTGSGFAVRLTFCHKCEIRKSKIASFTAGSGLQLQSLSSCLIADNIINDSGPSIELFNSSCNNAFLYNYIPDWTSANFLYHGTGGCLDLFEGNVCSTFKSDGYFGSNSSNTMFRNWFHSIRDDAPTDHAIHLKRASYGFANVGNVLGWDNRVDGITRYGYPNIGNEGTNGGTAEWSTGDFWADWKKTGTLTTRTSDTVATLTVSTIGDLDVSMQGTNGPFIYWSGGSRNYLDVTAISSLEVTLGNGTPTSGDVWPAESTAVEIWGGQPGFQERDLDVENTTEIVHNYISSATGTGSIDNPTANTLPNSLAYAAKPSWWNDHGFSGAWPPVNPDSPQFEETVIPAAYRFIILEGSLSTPTAPTGLNVVAE